MMISLPNATQFPLGRKQPKSTTEKRTQYKDATIRNKFAQTVSVITYNTISIQTMTIIALVWNQGKRTTLVNHVLREQNKKP